MKLRPLSSYVLEIVSRAAVRAARCEARPAIDRNASSRGIVPPANAPKVPRATRSILLKLLFLAAFMGPSSVSAQPMALLDPGIPGNRQYDEWLSANVHGPAAGLPFGSLTAGANPGYPGFFNANNAWPAPIGSSAPGSADAFLIKVANGAAGAPYPASGSIYFSGFLSTPHFNGGTLAVRDVTPIGNVENIVFQIQMGEAYAYDFLNGTLPTLNYNGGAQALAATGWELAEAFYNGTVEMPDGTQDVFINTYLLQWDVSGLGPISDFEIEFSGVQHAQLYAMRLDQSDEYVSLFATAGVPEPSSLAAVAICAIAAGFYGLRRVRRRSLPQRA